MSKQIPAEATPTTGLLVRVAHPAVLGLLFLSLAGCEVEYPQSTINPHSDFAEVIQSLYVSIFWWTMLILAVVWIALAYVLLRFRARPGAPPAKQTRGHLGLEIGWTVGPALIVLAIAIPTIQAVFDTQQSAGEDNIEVHVTGHQFWWEFHYPEYGVTTANEMWLPVDRPVTLRLESSDVIHSFWIPLLGGKRDVNPTRAVREGDDQRYNWLFFTPSETGVFLGQCAEFCGEAHALMRMRVVVEPQETFEDWLDRWRAGPEGPEEVDDADPEAIAQPPQQGDDDPQAQELDPPPPEEAPLVTVGRDTFFQSMCVACHAINQTPAQGQVGPNLTLIGERGTIGAGLLENNPENLARWISDPTSIKPGAQMPGTDNAMEIPREGGQTYSWPATGLSDEQVEAVVAYLLSLR